MKFESICDTNLFLETREALYLIKNKIDKDKTNSIEENKPIENIKIEDEEINEIPKPILNTNNTHYFETNQVVHEKEWDNSVINIIKNNTID